MKFIAALALTSAILFSSSSKGNLSITTSQKFSNLFTTAGYSTVFGAAMGTAILGLSKKPSSNLKYIGIGASVGFISGSILGIFTSFYTRTKQVPVNDINSLERPRSNTESSHSPFRFSISPLFETQQTGLAAHIQFHLP